MKLWDKGYKVNDAIEAFTVGKDRELDGALATYDVLGNMAHAFMLTKCGLLEEEEFAQLKTSLVQLHEKAEKGELIIQEGIEDIHSQVELLLTQELGDIGKKIHSARSRNDQVLVDVKMFCRDQVLIIAQLAEQFIQRLLQLAEQHKDVLIPGYTHLQVAMPSSFGLWFGAYAESLIDDLDMLRSAYEMANQNPLGSAAGYGSSFPIDRQLTTDLLGFENMHYNVVYAQMTRGKTERVISYALASIASSLSKMAMDVCLYMSQNFGFLTFPKELTTGSSIMPHKKNPDVFELIRGKCNKIQALPVELTFISSNLPSGYHRDLQLLKESFMPALEELKNCLSIADMMMENVQINPEAIKSDIYDYIYSVEEVNRHVIDGLPFRDAYKKVGMAIEAGNFSPDKNVVHTHAGSLGNLCLEDVKARLNSKMAYFSEKGQEVQAAYEKLLK